MNDYLRKNGWAFYLGISLTAIGGLSITEWRLWAIAVPTILLVVIKD